MAGGAFSPDAAVVLLDNPAAQGEAQAGTAKGAGVGGVALLEAVEDVFQLLWVDAAAPVFDDETDFVFAERMRGQPDRCLRGRELEGVGQKLMEYLQDTLFVGQDRCRGSIDAEADAGRGGLRMGCLDCAAQQMEGFDGHAAHRQLALLAAVEVQNVVDQAHQPVAVANGHLQHLALLLRPAFQSAGCDKPKRGAEGGKRSAQFVTDGGGELVLHQFEAAALGDILEGHDHAGDMPILNDRAGAVLDGNGGAVIAPEDLIAHVDGLAVAHGLENWAVVSGAGCAVGVAMVDGFVDVAIFQLGGGVTENARSGLVDKCEAAVEVNAVDAICYRVQDQLALVGSQVQSFLCLVLLGYVHAVVDDEGPLVRQFHAAAAEGDEPEDAVAAAHP